eukprot:15453927-Alexandrium_andersonii.AAC.1
MTVAGEDASEGALVLHASADEARVWRDAVQFAVQRNLDEACARYVRSLWAHVVDAVARREHGWRRARALSNA